MLRRRAVQPLSITLRGVTNDSADCGVDAWRTVTFPLLRTLTGRDDFELKVGGAWVGGWVGGHLGGWLRPGEYVCMCVYVQLAVWLAGWLAGWQGISSVWPNDGLTQ